MRVAVTASPGPGPGERPVLRAPPASLSPLPPWVCPGQRGRRAERTGKDRGRARGPLPDWRQLGVGGLRRVSGQRCGHRSVVVQPLGRERAPGRPDTPPLAGARSASHGPCAGGQGPRRPGRAEKTRRKVGGRGAEQSAPSGGIAEKAAQGLPLPWCVLKAANMTHAWCEILEPPTGHSKLWTVTFEATPSSSCSQGQPQWSPGVEPPLCPTLKNRLGNNI